jgi:uncharacterized repeat protein (TIGR03803 family)
MLVGSLIQLRVLACASAFALFVVASAPQVAHAQTFKVLYSFTDSPDGGEPYSALILDNTGKLYGSTAYGGIPGCDLGLGCGTVFELAPSSGGWSESVLYAFPGGADGNNPGASLIFDKDGNLYGTTGSGGTAGCTFGNGVAFELSPGSSNWTETVLYSFEETDGNCGSLANFIFDKVGNLYSTHPAGTKKNGSGDGSVYELAKHAGGWKEDVLYIFYGKSTGIVPLGAPIFDVVGNLYGTTSCCNGSASVWELIHGTWKEKTLYQFSFEGPHGDKPGAGLAFDTAGNLYGQTELGGKYNLGVVFRLAPAANGKWNETVLHSFKGGSDGDTPVGSVPVFDKAGNLYGTTFTGGDPSCNPPYGCGTVFKLTPGKGGRWRETVLHRFTGGSDGSGPYSGVILDAAGNLYGTATYGGNPGCFQNSGCGVVFEITP